MEDIMYTGGTFDITHAGHVNFFRQSKELFPSMKLVVSLNTDEFIKEYKGKAPLFTFMERKYFLLITGYVDGVVENIGGADSKPAIMQVKPKVIVIGNDWLEKDYCQQMNFNSEWLRQQGISLCYVPYTDFISTSIIKERMKNAG